MKRIYKCKKCTKFHYSKRCVSCGSRRNENPPKIVVKCQREWEEKEAAKAKMNLTPVVLPPKENNYE